MKNGGEQDEYGCSKVAFFQKLGQSGEDDDDCHKLAGAVVHPGGVVRGGNEEEDAQPVVTGIFSVDQGDADDLDGRQNEKVDPEIGSEQALE